MTYIFHIFFIWCIGAIIGSFLNVLILRFGTQKSALLGRSLCVSCKKALAWHELIPVFSYLIQQGRCTSCKAHISFQYLLIEFFTGLAAVFVFTPFPATASEGVVAMTQFLIVLLLLILFMIDLRTFLLPDAYIVLLSLAIVMYGVISESHMLSLAGAGIAAGALGIVWAITKGKGMGLGDVKIMVPLGLLLGPFGSFALLLLSFTAGGVVGIYLLSMRKVTRKTVVPFGPFITGSALVLILFPGVVHALAQFVFGSYLGVY